jgi:hypothetical protein
MCRHPYGADWPHAPEHCPNLIPNEIDRTLLLDAKKYGTGINTMNVTVKYAEFRQHHASLVEFWNDWYKSYVQASFPRLIVRFDDSAKKGAAHGAQKTSYVDALVKYGTEAGRYTGFEQADLEYARKHLDPDLMRLFGYHYPPVSGH